MKDLLAVLASRSKFWSKAMVIAVATLVFSAIGWTRAQDGHVTAGLNEAAAANGHKLVWLNNLKAGLESADRFNQENSGSGKTKYVMVDLYTDWCGWCKKLDKDTYTDPSVLELLNNQFVCVKLDAEDGADGEAFAKEHKVRGYPCIIVLESSGKMRGISYGYRTAPDFLELMKGVIESPNPGS